LHYSKLKISSEATTRLRMLKQRTGLTPNLLCRIALMMSLEEGPLGNIPLPNEDGSEFNAYTLIRYFLIICVGIFTEVLGLCLFATRLRKVY